MSQPKPWRTNFYRFQTLYVSAISHSSFLCISIYISPSRHFAVFRAQLHGGSMTGWLYSSVNTSWRLASRSNSSSFLLDEARRRFREKVHCDTRSAMLVQARRWVPQGFAVGSTHDGAARMEMFTCLTKRIARHLPGYRHTQCKFQFYPTIKVNLLSGNFLLFFSL